MAIVNDFPAYCGEKCLKCGACVQKCPNQAITLVANGFQTDLHFNPERCVRCGLCRQVCPVSNKQDRISPQRAFVATAKDAQVRKNSASGGAFAVRAEQ